MIPPLQFVSDEDRQEIMRLIAAAVADEDVIRSTWYGGVAPVDGIIDIVRRGVGRGRCVGSNGPGPARHGANQREWRANFKKQFGVCATKMIGYVAELRANYSRDNDCTY